MKKAPWFANRYARTIGDGESFRVAMVEYAYITGKGPRWDWLVEDANGDTLGSGLEETLTEAKVKASLVLFGLSKKPSRRSPNDSPQGRWTTAHVRNDGRCVQPSVRGLDAPAARSAASVG